MRNSSNQLTAGIQAPPLLFCDLADQMESELLTEFFGNGSQASGNWCYAYNRCTFHYVSTRSTRPKFPLGRSVTLVRLDPRAKDPNLFCVAISQRPCAHPHPDLRYTDSSAAWVLIASIIVFFMVLSCCFCRPVLRVCLHAQKAGFMLLEVAFARTVKEKRYVIVTVRWRYMLVLLTGL